MQFHSTLLLALSSFQVAVSQPVTIAPFSISAPVPDGMAAPDTIAPVMATVAPDTIAPVASFPTGIPSSSPSGSHFPSFMPSVMLPEEVAPRADRRCGVTEIDSRGNCGKLCSVNSECDTDAGEFCWGTFANYCHIKPEGHPNCDTLDAAEQVVRRCGFDEASARGYCGIGCLADIDCPVDLNGRQAERCFPVQLNFCEFFKEQDENATTTRKLMAGVDGTLTNAEYFEEAKEILAPYFGPPTSAPVPENTPSTPTFGPAAMPSSAAGTSFLLGAVLAIAVSIF